MALSSVVPVLAAGRPRDGTDRIIIRLRDRAENRATTLGATRMSALSSRAGVALRHLRAMSGDAQVIALPSFHSPAQLDALIRRLKADPDIEFAEPDARRYPALVPNDPQYATQWHYMAPASYAGAANLPLAWDITTGDPSIVVAVIDTGIRPHSEFSGRTVAGYDMVSLDNAAYCPRTNCTSNDGDGRDSDPSDPGDWITVNDDNGTNDSGFFTACCSNDGSGVACNSSWHGTHVAGTIGATGNNGSAVAGVNWGSKILPVRVLGKCGGYTSDIVDGMRWAAGIAVAGVPNNANPAKVLNMSLGGSAACPGVEQSAVNDVLAAGAVIVAAAGNSDSDANSFSPASCTGVISVAAVTQDGSKAFYSNTGSSVKIAAPGGDTPMNPRGIYSTLNTGTQGPVADTQGYEIGTSMAAPHVSGVISLMLSVAPTLTPAQVLSTLQSTARAFPGSGCNTSICGAGLLDGNLAVRASVPLPTIVDITATAQGASSITYTWGFSGSTPTNYKVYNNATSALLASPASPTYTKTGLQPNETFTVKVSAVRLSLEGSVAVGPPGVTLAAPPTSPIILPHISSMTVKYTVCAVGTCTGYQLDVSTAANLTGLVYSSATSNRAAASLQADGLSPLTVYYTRLSSLNSDALPTPTFPGPGTTLTDKVAPIVDDFSGVDVDRIRFNWLQSSNPSGATYEADASTAANLTGTLLPLQSGVDVFTALFTGLSANTSYYFRARAVGGPYVSSGPVSTFGAAPGVVGLSGVGTGGITLTWSANGNGPYTLYQAQVSASAGFSPVLASSATRNTSAVFTGLASNTTYFGRVQSLPNAGPASALITLGSASTLALPVVSGVVSAVGTTGFTGSFTNGGNPPTTMFKAQISTAVNFSGLLLSSTTRNLTASFSGLTSNLTYYFQAAALNNDGAPTAFSAPIYAETLAVPPVAAAPGASLPSISSLRFHWSGGDNAPSSHFTAQISSVSAFTSGLLSSSTANSYADFTGLLANTIYYLRAKVNGLSTTPDSAYAEGLASRATLTAAPGAPGAPFRPVDFGSVTVSWIALPAAPQVATAEGYRLELSTASDFSGVLFSSTVMGSASSTAAVKGLEGFTTYYARVGALNWDSAGAFTVLGSTRTLQPKLSSGVFSGAAMTLTLLPAAPQLKSVSVTVPAGAFPPGTVLTVNASVGSALPDVVSNQGSVQAVGDGVGVSISAGGAQPMGNVTVRMEYDPLFLLAGNPALMQLYRYDDSAGTWSILPSAVDTKTHILTALTNHFSFFAPFFVTAGRDFDAVNIFPIPWQPGSSDALFNAGALTISNLPAASVVRLFTLTGELLWRGEAAANGILTWTGENEHGRKAGSGTYLVVIEKDGRRATRRVVVVR